VEPLASVWLIASEEAMANVVLLTSVERLPSMQPFSVEPLVSVLHGDWTYTELGRGCIENFNTMRVAYWCPISHISM
jgi:hypothetical protein